MQLQGQVALVTGAGQGIGKAIALRFAREGADIAIADINTETAQATAAEIQQIGRKTFVQKTDVSDYDQVQALVAGTLSALGKIDILVNNAGIGRGQRFLEVTQENWQQHINPRFAHFFPNPLFFR